jgi:hypothetical protein
MEAKQPLNDIIFLRSYSKYYHFNKKFAKFVIHFKSSAMANDNEDIKKESSENSEEPKHHKSWVGNLIDKIQDLDTDFPLSGGEEDPRPTHHHTEEKPEEGENKEGSEHHKSFLRNIIDKIQDLDTDFPLSGGEEDPRPPHHHPKPEDKDE